MQIPQTVRIPEQVSKVFHKLSRSNYLVTRSDTK